MKVDEPYRKVVSAMNKCPHCYQDLMTAGCVNQFCSGKRFSTLDVPMGEWMQWLEEMGKVMNFGDAITVEQKREAIKSVVKAAPTAAQTDEGRSKQSPP